MDPFLFRLGRLGFVRGARTLLDPPWWHVWWRFWWLGPNAAQLLAATKKIRLMHWAPATDGHPLCGAEKSLWTIEYDYVNCSVCRALGRMKKLSYEAGMR